MLRSLRGLDSASPTPVTSVGKEKPMADSEAASRTPTLTMKWVLAVTLALSITVNPAINFISQTEGPGRAHAFLP
jgi:hypothetical protein